MQLMNLDVASEYLVMAATLAHIKSKMLLPAPPPGQEDDALALDEEDPREALIRRLLEYQKYKQARARRSPRAASRVATSSCAARSSKRPCTAGLPPLAEVPLFSLVEAFQRVLSRSEGQARARRRARSHQHHRSHQRARRPPDRAPTRGVRGALRAKRARLTRFDLVITFLALLEMTRLRMMRLYQVDPEGPLHVELNEGADASVVSGDENETTHG